MPTDLTAYQLVEPGDLAVNKMKAWQGSLGLSQLEGVVSPAYFIYTPISRSFDQRYLNYLIRSRLLAAELARLSDGVRPQQWDLDPKAFERVPLPEPPMKEQRRIADYLDRETTTIDALIEKQQRLRSVLKERRQELVRAHLADVGPQVQLRHLVVRERPMTYGILQAGEHDDGGVPYIGPADISRVGGTPALQDLRRTTVEIAAQYQRSTLRPGDLVASIGPAYGHVMEVSEELDGANLTQDTVRLALDPDRAERRYLMWVLQGAASRDFWNFEITGATFRRLNLGTLARTPVPLPSLNEQREIADHLDRETAKIDALIAKAERFIELAQERRAALITAAVTGQIEIPT
ncbi:hypothetical protein HMPREF2863_10565 [Micrococcus sp. HMSC067E09]|nr:hypothetical protein HMPREF2863_10565 [Micrococcus sp. HMSC067E09]